MRREAGDNTAQCFTADIAWPLRTGGPASPAMVDVNVLWFMMTFRHGAEAMQYAIMLAFVIVSVIGSAHAQFLDQGKDEVARHLGGYWVSEMAVNDTAKLGYFTLICTMKGNLYLVDRLIDLDLDTPIVVVRMEPGRRVSLTYLRDNDLRTDFFRRVPYFADCDAWQGRKFANVFMQIVSINGVSRLSELWSKLLSNK
jgi:hypothetical protein